MIVDHIVLSRSVDLPTRGYQHDPRHMICIPVYLEPTVHMIGQPMINMDAFSQMKVDLGIADWVPSGREDGVVLAENGAKLCYMSQGRGRNDISAFMDNLISQEHTSVLEHGMYTFVFSGLDRYVTHELVRHRVGVAYSQLSTRYVDMLRFGIVVPYSLWIDKPSYQDWYDISKQQYEKYHDLWRECEKENASTRISKAQREDLVAFLPSMVETRIQFSANINILKHIFTRRCAPDANKRIRSLFMKVFKLMNCDGREPFFSDFTLNEAQDGLIRRKIALAK